MQNKKKILFLLFLLFVFLTSCIQPRIISSNPGELTEQYYLLVNGLAETISVIDRNELTIINDYITTGRTPGSIKIYRDGIYQVNSGDNSIKIYNLFLEELTTIFLPVNSSPIDMILVDNTIYCINFISGHLYALTHQGNKLNSYQGLNSPQFIANDGDKLYILNTSWNASTSRFGQGYLDIISREDLTLQQRLMTAKNPTSLFFTGSQVHIICTGEHADDDGVIEIRDINSLSIITNLNIGGSPFNYDTNTEHVFLAGESGILRYDFKQLRILNDKDRPLVFFITLG